MVRDATRRMQWRRADIRRDLRGIGRGVDRDATTAILRHAGTSEFARGYLRVILSGGMYTGERRADGRCGPAVKALHSKEMCRHCGSAVADDERHKCYLPPSLV